MISLWKWCFKTSSSDRNALIEHGKKWFDYQHFLGDNTRALLSLAHRKKPLSKENEGKRLFGGALLYLFPCAFAAKTVIYEIACTPRHPVKHGT